MVNRAKTDWASEIGPMAKAAVGNGLQRPEDAWVIQRSEGDAEADYKAGYVYVRRKSPYNPEYIVARIIPDIRRKLVAGLCVKIQLADADEFGCAWEVIGLGSRSFEQYQGGTPDEGASPHDHQTEAGGGTLDAAAIATGTFDDARLSANVMLLDGVQTVTGAKTFGSGDLIATDADLNTPDIDGGTITGATELTVVSTSSGSIPMPVMTETQRDAIGTPVEGMWVFNSDTSAPNYYDGADWQAVSSVAAVDASDVTYTPGVSGDWDTPPAEVASGLDELAARVELLEGGGVGTLVNIAPSHCDLRLTAETGVPLSISDQTGATSVYLTPFRGAIIALYDGSGWAGYPTSQLTLSLSGFDRHRLYDIWCYLDTGTPTLDSTAWNAPTTGAITTVTNASPPVVTSAAHGLSVDDIVTIYGVVGSTGVNTTSRISAVTTDTFTPQTLDAVNLSAPGAYSSGGTWVKKYSGGTRATALTYQNGVLVKTGDATRRYVGTVCINATGGQTEDTIAERLVYSHINFKVRDLRVIDTTDSWTYAVSAWRGARNSFFNRVDLVLGVAEHMVTVDTATTLSGSSNGIGGVGVDSVSANSAQIRDWIATTTSFAASGHSVYRGYLSAGLHFLQRLEYRIAGTSTFVGDAGQPNQSGMTAIIEA
jgi:hypothetical protein